jgi:unsaturated rhamnogalacturonyl hydrolase
MDSETRIKKVIRAMLAMQRRAWEQGVAAQALLELGETELTVLLAKDALVNQSKDGRLGLNGDRGPVADPASNGEPVMYAAKVTGDERLKTAWERMLDFLLYQAPKTRDGIIYHNHIENRIWVDAFYMVPPFLAVAGHPEEAVKQILGYRKRLWDGGRKLFYHIWDEDTKSFTRKLFWGVGNGWAAAGYGAGHKSASLLHEGGEGSAGRLRKRRDRRMPGIPEGGCPIPRHPGRCVNLRGNQYGADAQLFDL